MRRYLVALAAVLLASLPLQAQPREMPGHWMNPHCPFVITNSYWHPGGYGIWGPTDIVYPVLQPVNHIGPPPFGPRCWYMRPRLDCDGNCPWLRSPRDFFMLPIPR